MTDLHVSRAITGHFRRAGARNWRALALFLAVAMLPLGSSCRKKEQAVTPSGQKVAGPAGPPPTPTAEPEESPSIRPKAESGKPPYSGLASPHGAAVDGQGRLWVASTGNNRIRVFDPEGGFLGGWGGRGDGQFGLREPNALAIHGNDLYVADTWNGRLRHFTLAGEFKGSAATLYGPRAVAVGPDGTVWLTDAGNNRVCSFDPALQKRRDIGKRGSGSGEFVNPVGIAVGSSGSIYVGDTGNNRVVVLDPQGKPKSEFHFTGWEKNWHSYIEADGSERLYVSIPADNAVVELSRSGGILKRWMTDDAGKKFVQPTGLAIDQKRGILYVVNSGDSTVSRLRLSETRGR